MGSSERVKQIFGEAHEMPLSARRAFLDAVCAGEPALRAEVEALLVAFDEANEFLISKDVSAHAVASPNAVCPMLDAGSHSDRRLQTESGEAEGIQTEPILRRERPGKVIGRYKLLQEIGHGGFGTVFMAEQREPIVRKVALKVIKLGMDTRQVIGRFQAERQALAMMDHPNIAKVLDAGATDTGRPYFVMELVKGVPITQYCDDNRLPPRDRLTLFSDVCHAVQHAHQKGVIHRDLKPSNVLVSRHDDKPVVKIIDFGIAKAIGGKLTEQTLFTEFHALIGTPVYMSPEQAGMSDLDVDTRSDIYSLGVLLYELLTGTTPFDERTLRRAAQDEIRRMIREVEPPKPSTRVGSAVLTTSRGGSDGATPREDGPRNGPYDRPSLEAIARARHTDPKSLIRLLRGDLDWIVMKCLEKDRQRRYETANGLALEIRRHLNDEPVLAGPPSVLYRTSKLIHRYRGIATAIAIFLLLLVASTVITTSLYLSSNAARRSALESRDLALRAEEKAERDRQNAQDSETKARLETAKTKAVTDFLWHMLAMGDPSRSKGRDLTVRDVLDEASATVEAKLVDQPEVQAKVRAMIAWTYVGLGLGEEAIPHLEYALASYRERFGPEHSETLSMLRQLGLAHHLADNFQDFVTVFEEYLAIARRQFAEDDPTTVDALSMLGNAYDNLGDYKRAEPLLVRALDLAVRVCPKNDWRLVGTYANLGGLYRHLGRLDEAEQALIAAQADSNVGPQFKVRFQYELAWIYGDQGRAGNAVEQARVALRLGVETLGNQHPETLMAMNALANALVLTGNTVEAEEHFRRVIGFAKDLRTRHRLALRDATRGYLFLLVDAGRNREAEEQFQVLLGVERGEFGDDHRATLRTHNDLGWVRQQQGRFAEAADIYSRTLETARRVLGEDELETERSMFGLAVQYSSLGRHDEAEPLIRIVLQRRIRVLGEIHPESMDARQFLGVTILRGGRIEEGMDILERALELAEKANREETREGLRTMHHLAEAYQRSHRFDEGEKLYKRALAGRSHLLGAEHPEVLHSMINLGSLYVEQERYSEAEELLAHTLEIQRRVMGVTHPYTMMSMTNLARSLRGLGKTDELRALLLELIAARHELAESEYATADHINGYARLLLTVEPQDLRDDLTALTWAQRAVELAKQTNLNGRPLANILDTLALAQHRTGDTATAIETQRRAIGILPSTADEAQRSEFEGRLAEFEAAVGAAKPSAIGTGDDTVVPERP